MLRGSRHSCHVTEWQNGGNTYIHVSDRFYRCSCTNVCRGTARLQVFLLRKMPNWYARNFSLLPQYCLLWSCEEVTIGQPAFLQALSKLHQLKVFGNHLVVEFATPKNTPRYLPTEGDKWGILRRHYVFLSTDLSPTDGNVTFSLRSFMTAILVEAGVPLRKMSVKLKTATGNPVAWTADTTICRCRRYQADPSHLLSVRAEVICILLPTPILLVM